MSYLTQSYDKLKEELITALEGEGFPYNPNTTSFTEYLSLALGNSSAHLRRSFGELLSDLDAQYGGSLSELRASIAHLMDDTVANIGAGGGGGGGEEEEDMALITSGSISSPVSYFDVALPSGYVLYTLELIDFLFTGSNTQPTVTCIFSPDDGANWYNNTDDFNSYSHSGLSEDVSTAIPSEGMDSVANLAANGASKDIYLSGTIKIWPGAVGTKAIVRSDLNFNSGDPFTWNSMTSRLETTGRQNKVRFSFGDNSLVPPDGTNEWSAGTYLLFGVPTP
jgi:hypothetical protein